MFSYFQRADVLTQVIFRTEEEKETSSYFLTEWHMCAVRDMNWLADRTECVRPLDNGQEQLPCASVSVNIFWGTSMKCLNEGNQVWESTYREEQQSSLTSVFVWVNLNCLKEHSVVVKKAFMTDLKTEDDLTLICWRFFLGFFQQLKNNRNLN